MIRLTKRNLKFIIPMKKALEVAKEISREFSQSIEGKRFKSVFCDCIGNESKDGFSVHYQSKELSIQAANPRSAAYAISQLKMAVEANRIREVVGDNQPLYNLRPIWVHCDKHISLTENVGLYLPSIFLGKNKQTFETFCHRLLELGFNAVILGSRNETFEYKSSTSFKELEVLWQLFDEYGIQLIVKPVIYHPTGCDQVCLNPIDDQFCQRVSQALSDLRQVTPSLNTFFWESVYCEQDFHYHPIGRGDSKFEKTLKELRCVEKGLSDDQTLIYYLPTTDDLMARKQANWLVRFLNAAGPKTICAFSCVGGSFASDHLRRHPFWEVLYQLDRPPTTPGMPIMNTGGLGQGEGYWPNFPLEMLEEYLSYRNEFPIAGFIHSVRNIPKRGSLADACMWVAGLSMWRRSHPMQLLETWYRVHFSEESFVWFFSLLKKARVVILEISAFEGVDQEEVSCQGVKCRIDSLLAQIDEIEVMVKVMANRLPISKGALKELFQLFAKDARRKILYFAHQHDVSISSSSGLDFKGDGVWTQLSSGRVGEGAASAGQVSFYEVPNIGPEGSSSHKVHWEVNIEV
ncbi:MAG: hypothetical protein AAGG81_00520 [Chlamydiota bacterium]